MFFSLLPSELHPAGLIRSFLKTALRTARYKRTIAIADYYILWMQQSPGQLCGEGADAFMHPRITAPLL
jgi:hypothetical protein